MGIFNAGRDWIARQHARAAADCVLVEAVHAKGRRSGYHPQTHLVRCATFGALARLVLTGRAETLCGRTVTPQWSAVPRDVARPDGVKIHRQTTCHACASKNVATSEDA